MIFYLGVVWFLCAMAVYLFPYRYFSEIAISFLPYLAPLSILLVVVLLVQLFFVPQKRIKNCLSRLVILGLGYLGFLGVFRVSLFYDIENTEASSSNEVITLLYANVYVENFYYSGLSYAIDKYDPDIIVFVEFADHHYFALKSLLDDKYSFVNREIRDRGYDGTLLASRYDFSYADVNVESSIDLERYRSSALGLDLSVVHTAAPVSSWHYELRRKQLEQLSSHMNFLFDGNIPFAKLVLGDFNLSPWSYDWRVFYESLDDDWSVLSRHVMLGMTWQAPVLGFLKSHIDHILGDKIILHDIEIAEIEGSDHNGYFARFSVDKN